MNHRRTHNAAGFTLIEVLVAVVVFAIGLLGVAGLQVAGMRFTHGSQLRSVAAMQAESIADRMRANRVGVRNGNYNILGTMPGSFAVDCGAASCNPQKLATFDLATWNTRTAAVSDPREANNAVLPEGDGMVCLDSTPDDGSPGSWACDNIGIVYAVKVTWRERNVNQNDTKGEGVNAAAADRGTYLQRMVMRVVQQ